MKQVKILDNVNVMLTEIVKARRESGVLSVNKQSVTNELIVKAYKREVKSKS